MPDSGPLPKSSVRNDRSPRAGGRGLGLLLTTAAWSLAAAVTLPPPAPADWLVTTRGERVETRGPWRIEGRRIVYDSPNGSLTAVRLDDIDLEATRALADRLAHPSEPKEPDRKPAPRLVLRGNDVPHASSAPLASEAGTEAAGSASGATGPPASAAAEEPAGDPTDTELPVDVVVASWQPKEAPDGLAFEGNLDNESDNVAAQVQVQASIFDRAGTLIDSRWARLAARSLPPHGSTTFEVRFPGTKEFANIRFSTSARGVAPSHQAVPAIETDAAAPAAEGAQPPGV